MAYILFAPVGRIVVCYIFSPMIGVRTGVKMLHFVQHHCHHCAGACLVSIEKHLLWVAGTTAPAPSPNMVVTCRPGGKVQRIAVLFTADYQYIFIHARSDELVTNAKRVDKTAALVTHIKCANVCNAKFALYKHATAGK